MGVLEAVQGRTAKGLPQVYQRIFRLEQLGVEIVTPIIITYFIAYVKPEIKN